MATTMLPSKPAYAFIAFLIIGLLCTSAWGQKKKNESTEGLAKGNAKEWTAQYDQRFKKQNPLLGQTAPEADCYDESGEPFRLSKIRGKYAVLVFGCLT